MGNVKCIMVVGSFFGLVAACSPNKNNVNPCSQVSAIIDDTSQIQSIGQEGIGFGEVNFTLDNYLAGIVYSNQDSRSEGNNGEALKCRTFLVQDKTGTDIWSSRHCLIKLAVVDPEFTVFLADGKKETFTNIQGFDQTHWKPIKNAIKGMDTALSEGEKDSDSKDVFSKRFLFQNFYNSELFTFVRSDANHWRSQLLRGGEFKKQPASKFYQGLINQLNDEQINAGFDSCSSAYSMTSKEGQSVCFMPSDMVVLRSSERKLDKDSKISKASDYAKLKKAVTELDQGIDRFLVSESLYRGSEMCVGKEACNLTVQLDSIANAADRESRLGGGFKSLLAQYRKHNGIADLLAEAKSHRLGLIASYEKLGVAWKEIAASNLKPDVDLLLLSSFREEGANQSLIGSLDLKKHFEKSTSTITLLENGLFLEIQDPSLRFEVSDSGSMLTVNGLPLASLSLVDGKSSAGGLAALPNEKMVIAQETGIKLPGAGNTEVANNDASGTDGSGTGDGFQLPGGEVVGSEQLSGSTIADTVDRPAAGNAEVADGENKGQSDNQRSAGRNDEGAQPDNGSDVAEAQPGC